MNILGNSTITVKDGRNYIVFDNGIEIPCDFVAVKEKETGEIKGFFPQIHMADDADYRWQLRCLKDRLENPKKYEDNLNENVSETIQRLTRWVSYYENNHPDIKARRAAGYYKDIEPNAELIYKHSCVRGESV